MDSFPIWALEQAQSVVLLGSLLRAHALFNSFAGAGLFFWMGLTFALIGLVFIIIRPEWWRFSIISGYALLVLVLIIGPHTSRLFFHEFQPGRQAAFITPVDPLGTLTTAQAYDAASRGVLTTASPLERQNMAGLEGERIIAFQPQVLLLHGLNIVRSGLSYMLYPAEVSLRTLAGATPAARQLSGAGAADMANRFALDEFTHACGDIAKGYEKLFGQPLSTLAKSEEGQQFMRLLASSAFTLQTALDLNDDYYTRLQANPVARAHLYPARVQTFDKMDAATLAATQRRQLLENTRLSAPDYTDLGFDAGFFRPHAKALEPAWQELGGTEIPDVLQHTSPPTQAPVQDAYRQGVSALGSQAGALPVMLYFANRSLAGGVQSYPAMNCLGAHQSLNRRIENRLTQHLSNDLALERQRPGSLETPAHQSLQTLMMHGDEVDIQAVFSTFAAPAVVQRLMADTSAPTTVTAQWVPNLLNFALGLVIAGTPLVFAAGLLLPVLAWPAILLGTLGVAWLKCLEILLLLARSLVESAHATLTFSDPLQRLASLDTWLTGAQLFTVAVLVLLTLMLRGPVKAFARIRQDNKVDRDGLWQAQQDMLANLRHFMRGVTGQAQGEGGAQGGVPDKITPAKSPELPREDLKGVHLTRAEEKPGWQIQAAEVNIEKAHIARLDVSGESDNKATPPPLEVVGRSSKQSKASANAGTTLKPGQVENKDKPALWEKLHHKLQHGYKQAGLSGGEAKRMADKHLKDLQNEDLKDLRLHTHNGVTYLYIPKATASKLGLTPLATREVERKTGTGDNATSQRYIAIVLG